jgi:hypothetical protein
MSDTVIAMRLGKLELQGFSAFKVAVQVLDMFLDCCAFIASMRAGGYSNKHRVHVYVPRAGLTDLLMFGTGEP